MPTTKNRRIAQRLADIKKAVREAGIKLTHQRLEIIRELISTEAHPDAETVFNAVREHVPTISLDTVYRTLWMLHDLGLVRTTGRPQEGVRFDANLERHHHYVCVGCGLIRDFESDVLNELSVPRTVTKLGSVLDAHVEVRGICATCQRARKTHKKSKSR